MVGKGAFQELDAVSLLAPHTKLAIRPAIPATSDAVAPGIVTAIRDAYRAAWYGCPGPAFVDLPADVIQGETPDFELVDAAHGGGNNIAAPIPPPPRPAGDPAVIAQVAELLRSARAPLVVIGKGAAYGRAETAVRVLIAQTGIPFLPTPMGKGVVSDEGGGPNVATARSAALKNADVVLLLGARLNWILHFGEPPKWSPHVRIVQVNVNAEEIGRNAGDAGLGIVGDVGTVVRQLLGCLGKWHYVPSPLQSSGPSPNPNITYPSLLAEAANKNETRAIAKADKPTPPGSPLTFSRAFHLIKQTLDAAGAGDDDIVYVSEGANTMDISRSAFPIQRPRHRLDAGTYATMGVGLGYVIAAHAAYNLAGSGEEQGPNIKKKQKKVVALEGDSAFGFSAMEVETLARYQIPALLFILNNSGIYHGDSTSEAAWRQRQEDTVVNWPRPASPSEQQPDQHGLRSTSLFYETRYELLGPMVGGTGYLVRTEAELVDATRRGFADNRVVIVNVIVDPGVGQKIEFGWQASARKGKEEKARAKGKKENLAKL